jgi:DNA-binding transcriptional LysR family regulator
MKWDDLRIFLTVARSRSLSEAAVTLDVNQSTVSRRLTNLERHLKPQLLERTSSGPVLTESGNDLLPMAQKVEDEFFQIDRQVTGRDMRLSGRLRITCIDMLVDRLLAPHLAAFTEQHPDIELELLTAFRPLDLMRREADVAIRASDGPPQALVGRRMFDFNLAVYASSKLAAEIGENADPSQLEWIGLHDVENNNRVVKTRFPTANICHWVDGLFMQNALVREGIGVAALPCYWADSDPNLIRVYPEPYAPNGLGFWVLIHPDIRRTARVRAFVDFVTGALKDHQQAFEG